MKSSVHPVIIIIIFSNLFILHCSLVSLEIALSVNSVLKIYWIVSAKSN